MKNGIETGNFYSDTDSVKLKEKQELNAKYGLSAEKHIKMRGLRQAVDSELYKKYALYYGNKLIGYLMLNEVVDTMQNYIDDCEWQKL